VQVLASSSAAAALEYWSLAPRRGACMSLEDHGVDPGPRSYPIEHAFTNTGLIVCEGGCW
jgi:hypothetical protein